jgi:hypothetical protein
VYQYVLSPTGVENVTRATGTPPTRCIAVDTSTGSGERPGGGSAGVALSPGVSMSGNRIATWPIGASIPVA